MAKLIPTIRQWFSPIQPLSPGLYTYISPPNDPRNYRLHLRIDPGGLGVLVVNASTIIHLNQTATEYAYYFVKNIPVEQSVQKMSNRYNISKEQARQDYQDFTDRILGVIEMPDLDPEMYLGLDRLPVFTVNISAPYRLDCALTYNLPAGQPAESAPQGRVKEELVTADWLSMIDKAWKAGIPQIVFTGGEPTLREDLPQLITQAENNGQVVGLISDGLRLVDQAYLDNLLLSGLDHIMLVLYPDQNASWAALDRVLAADLFTVVHLTITPENQEMINGYLKKLADLGANAISLTTADPALGTTLTAARNLVAELKMELVWNLPVPYSAANPVALERNRLNTPEGAGKAWLYIEPDGDVLLGQGMDNVIGNLLRDSWEEIWKSPLRTPK